MPRREHGIYISALDVAFETAKALTQDDGIYDRQRASGRSISWACGALIYGAARLAERSADMEVEPFIWNTLRRALVMRMMEASELSADENLTRSQQIHVEHHLWKAAEDDGYKITHQLDEAIDRANEVRDLAAPLAVLAPLFGAQDSKISRLRLHFVRFSSDAESKVIPDFISELGF